MLHAHPRLPLSMPGLFFSPRHPPQPCRRPSSTLPTSANSKTRRWLTAATAAAKQDRRSLYRSTNAGRRTRQANRGQSSSGFTTGAAKWSNGGAWHRDLSTASSSSAAARQAESASPKVAAGADHAAVLRRMARYIEEDRSAADKLAEVIGEDTRSRLSAALDGMEYTVQQPTTSELRRVAFISSIPFLGFGFMDNAIMIVAGEYIDLTVGVAFGISTMAAAALGNTISDLFGLGLGGVIEDLATRLGLPPSNLSRAQMLLRRTRIASLVGSAIGVTLGCLIGMFPLLLMPDSDAVEAVKRKEKIVGLIDAVVTQAASFLSATSATLFILDRETGTLWARRRGLPGTPNAGHMQEMKLDLNDRGPVSGAVRAGEAVSVRAGKSGAAASMLCMPVLGADGAVAGVVQVVGKKDDNNAKTGGFTAEDAKDLSALCSHISVALENIKRADEADEVDLTETISLMRSYGGVSKQHPFPQHRSTNAARHLTPAPATPTPPPAATPNTK